MSCSLKKRNKRMFSYVDHQWLIPAYLSLSVGTVAAAALGLLSGWVGQVRAGFFTISAVLIFSIAIDWCCPRFTSLANSEVAATHQTPYLATRAAFTSRAYGLPRGNATAPSEVSRFARDSALVSGIVETARDSTLVYPGADGAALVKRGKLVAAPLIGGGFRRLAHAWSEQRLDLLWETLPADTGIARKRDVRERVRALMPLHTQGSEVTPAYMGDSLQWVVELSLGVLDLSIEPALPARWRRPVVFPACGDRGRRRKYWAACHGTGRLCGCAGDSWRARFPRTFARGASTISTRCPHRRAQPQGFQSLQAFPPLTPHFAPKSPGFTAR